MTKTQPTHDQSPVTQQADQQYFAQSGTQPVQYVLAAKSLKGVQGWLQFFVVILVLLSLGYINSFFGSLNHLSDPVAVVTMIFSPIIATLALLAVAFITMQKKLGKWFAAGTYLANTLFLLIKSITVFSVTSSSYSGRGPGSLPQLLGSVVTTIVVGGLLISYFFVSRRVKETLVN